MTAFFSLLKRDLKLAFRQGSDSVMVIVFFIVVVVLFPQSIGPEQKILARISAGVIWVAALLAAMLSMDRLWITRLPNAAVSLVNL